MYVAICSIVRNENLYIREWVEWHKRIGIDNIHLYDNNDVENLSDVIGEYIESGYVIVHNVRGREKGLVYDEHSINLQPKCYVEFYEGYSRQYDWICYIDIDEFIELNCIDIKGFLSQQKFNSFDTILVSWKTYDDNGYVVNTRKDVVSSYTHISKYPKHGVKSFVRTKKQIYDKSIKNLIHTFRLVGDHVCFVDGRQVVLTNKSNWYEFSSNEFECNIAHYKTKSLDEFIKRHLNRYWGTYAPYATSKTTLDKCIESYFLYNDYTYLKGLYIDTYKSKYDFIHKIDYENVFYDIQSNLNRYSDLSKDKNIVFPLDIFCYDTLLMREYCIDILGYDICPKVYGKYYSLFDVNECNSNSFSIRCNVNHDACIRFRYSGERHLYDIYDHMEKWKESKMSRYIKFCYYVEELIPNMTPEYVVRCIDNRAISINQTNIPNKLPDNQEKMKEFALALANYNKADICFYEYAGRTMLKWIKMNNLISM